MKLNDKKKKVQMKYRKKMWQNGEEYENNSKKVFVISAILFLLILVAYWGRIISI
ncbi:hypothetical protein ACIQYG_25890 [Peribacillus sp. NPDC096622]|uniref:hypothetical protein n=1 Tax=unclassified Peribacillus TaxID=2675266 RepID=UPI0037F8C1D9